MKIRTLILLGFSVTTLGACETMEGLKRDLSNVGQSVSTKVDSLKADDTTPASTIVNDGGCPPISVDPQLSTMSEFYDPDKPTAGTEVSTINLSGTKSACNIDGEYLEVQIELSFDGELGPKAKRKSGDRPFFAYPYFIAVTDKDDNELAKELFAASVTYESNQEKIQLVETIRQRLPLEDNGSLPAYQIKIGFQLSDEQLFHNAAK